MTEAVRIEHIDKLAHSQAGLTAAYKAGMMLIEKGWMRFPAASWDKPAFLGFVGDRCVGGINYHVSEDTLIFGIDFAWCAPDFPGTLATLLVKFRDHLRSLKFTALHFTAHAENDAMMRLVEMLHLEPVSFNYQMPVERFVKQEPSLELRK